MHLASLKFVAHGNQTRLSVTVANVVKMFCKEVMTQNSKKKKKGLVKPILFLHCIESLKNENCILESP